MCQQVLDNANKLKEHKKKEHTYHIVKFQCNECEFMANDPHTLQVHFGLNHSLNKQCGLCDENFKNCEQLEEHLTKCEIFVCFHSSCGHSCVESTYEFPQLLFENLPSVREHIKEKHKKDSPAHYSFSYYICHSKDKSEKEVNKQYISIYPKDW